MDSQDYLVVFAAFFLAFALGFAASPYAIDSGGEQEYEKDLSLRVDTDQNIANTSFDGNYLELRHEESEQARFYFYTNETGNAEEIENLRHDGTVQTTRKIRSFGNKTYFLYLRYQDDPNQSEDAYMELYRVEET